MASLSEEVAALRGTRPATMAGLFRIQSYNRLWRAMLVSSLGDWIGFIAVVDLVRRIGGARAGFAITGVMLARLLPSVVFGPMAGVLVDRFDRRRLMFMSDVLRGVGYASMPFIGSLMGIYVLSFVLECLSLLWTPARDASIPNLVPRRQLVNANSVALFTSYGTLPAGGLLFTSVAGVAIALGGTFPYLGENPEALALWLNGLTFAFSAYMIWGLSLRENVRRVTGFRAGQAWHDLVDGIRFLRDHSFARAMTVGILMAFMTMGSVIALGPIFASVTLRAGSAGWGILVTSVGIGLAIGMMSLGLLTKVFEKDTLFPLGVIWTATVLVALAVMPNIALAATLTLVAGLGAGIAWVSGYTLLHEHISDEFRGRTFATLTVLVRLGLLASLGGFPALAQALGDHTMSFMGHEIDLAGTRQALWVGATFGFAGGFLARRGLRRSRRSRPEPLALRPDLRRGERRGTFIVFEGVEGSGKGTQIRLVGQYLEELGYEVVVTREPGGTEIGERLRAALLDKDLTIDVRAEALLFAAARAQHVSSVIRPALERGKLVLCDRYVDSSIAYQGMARGLGEHDVLSLSAWATQGLFPDLVVLLNLDPEEGLARADRDDRFEGEDAAFHAKVADAYLRIADEHPERFVVVDATGEPGTVQGRVREALKRYLRIEDQRVEERE